MGTRVFVDTNVLIYHRDARDPAKQSAAAEWMALLWETRVGRLSTQVLQEYYVTVTAKLQPALAAEDARDDVAALATWHPVEVTSALIEAAWQVQDLWGFSFWDSLIVAAAKAERCGVLLTEDLQHGQDLKGLQVVSPFELSAADLLA